MRREDCRAGMKVIFGRGQGEKTLGKVVRCNQKKAKVTTLEARGSKHPKGVEWGVPYSMMEPAPADAKAADDAPEVVTKIAAAAKARRVPIDIEVGTKFRSHYADGNPEWTVIKKSGPNWFCRIEEDADWQGTEKVFMPTEILQAVGMANLFAELGNEHDAYYASLTPGQVVHYRNSHTSFVRCEAARDGNEMKLKPIALVGEWFKHDLPQRRPNGDINMGYHAKKIATGELFDPNASNIYENKPSGVDPRNMPALDLSVPDMTEEEAKLASLWETVEAAREALGKGDDPAKMIEAAKAVLTRRTLVRR